MSDSTRTPAPRKVSYWAGWAMSGLVIVFLFVDATAKLLALPAATETGAELGFAGVGMTRALGA